MDLPATLKELLILRMGGKCMDCGIEGPPIIFDFDHRNALEKAYSISRMLMAGPVSLLMDEVRKCDLVCANCHRVRTKDSPTVAAKRRRRRDNKDERIHALHVSGKSCRAIAKEVGVDPSTVSRRIRAFPHEGSR